jgi:hypothetical protein
MPMLRHMGMQVSALASLAVLALAGCGSDYPSVQAVQPDMQRAVQAAVQALGSEPMPRTVLSARCGPDDRGVNGDHLQVEHFGFPRPPDLETRVEVAAQELKRLGLTEGTAEGRSPTPLLVMHAKDRLWTLVVTSAATGGLVVNANAVVDEEDVPEDLLPRNGC